MYLKKINIVNFKNYPEASVLLEPGVNALLGGNGEGKTNLLDAIHYLSMCKSYFNPVDSQNIKFGEEQAMISGIFDRNGVEETISCGLKKNQRKIFKKNLKEYDRLADHIGFLPVVMISPVDSVLITEGSEERRKFIDSIISQTDKLYLDDLINYNRVLSQRNAWLKQAAQGRQQDEDTLLIWDEQLIQFGSRIHLARDRFVSELLPFFRKHYAFISDGKEKIDFQYDSQLSKGDFRDLLNEARGRDMIMQYTTVGIHKDDLNFFINGVPVKRFASQGQQKSFLIAVKLAQLDFISLKCKVSPLLLLDDIMDKLDSQRVSRLMQLVCQGYGQIIITDSHHERLPAIFSDLGIELPSFRVEKGAVMRLEVGEKNLI